MDKGKTHYKNSRRDFPPAGISYMIDYWNKHVPPWDRWGRPARNPAKNLGASDMKFLAGEYDVAVIGAGHAGIEAALAAARLGCSTGCSH